MIINKHENNKLLALSTFINILVACFFFWLFLYFVQFLKICEAPRQHKTMSNGIIILLTHIMNAVSMIWLGHFFLTTRLFCNHLLIEKITVQSNNKDRKSIQHSCKHLRWKTLQQYLKAVKIVQSASSQIISAFLDTFLKALTIFIYFALECL